MVTLLSTKIITNYYYWFKRKLVQVKLGGSKKIEAHAKGKLTAERINYLVDNEEDTIEIGAFAGEECMQSTEVVLLEELLLKLVKLSRLCVIVANDTAIKAGAWFPITRKKSKSTRNYIENKLPIVYLVDSAGVYLPMQDEIFLTKNTLVASLEITRLWAVWVLLKLQLLWELCSWRCLFTNYEWRSLNCW